MKHHAAVISTNTGLFVFKASSNFVFENVFPKVSVDDDIVPVGRMFFT